MDVFQLQRGGIFHTWRQRFPDGRPEQVTSGPTQEEGIAMAPDGRSFLTAVGVKQSSVWVHDSRGDRQVSLEGQAFQPKFTPDGTKLVYRIRSGASTELWVANLDSNHTEPLLPGFPILENGDSGAPWYTAYDFSPDGRQPVFDAIGRDGKSRLWLAPLDRSVAPRQIPDVEGEQPLFGSAGQIFFRKVDGTSAFLYSVRENGTGLRKANEFPVVNLFGAYPNHHWILAGRTSVGETLIPAAGGAPILTHLHPPQVLRWTGDAKYSFVVGERERNTTTYVVPLTPGQILPASIANAERFPSEAELARLPGVRTISAGDIVPARRPTITASRAKPSSEICIVFRYRKAVCPPVILKVTGARLHSDPWGAGPQPEGHFAFYSP